MTRQAFVAVMSAMLAVGVVGAAGTAPVSDLSITKTDGFPTYTAGGKLNYLITITNRGPDNVNGALLQDLVPATLKRFAWTCTVINGHCQQPTGTGTIEQTLDINAGGTIVLTLTGTLPTTPPNQISNNARITPPTNTTDPDPTNNHDTITLNRRNGPTRLNVTITPPTAIITSGVPIAATMTTTNIGTETATNVLTCATLPTGITVTAPQQGGFPQNGRYCWRTNKLAPGNHTTYRFQLQGDNRLAGRIRLNANAHASNAPQVKDTSRLIILAGKITKTGGYTG